MALATSEGSPAPVEVDRRNPVVTRDAGFEALVRVARVGVPGIPYQIRPGGAIVPRHLDQVPGDSGAAIAERGVPLQFDHRGTVGGRREVARLAGDPGARLSGDILHRDIEAERAIADQIPEAVVGAAVVEKADIVAGQDGLGQGQEHLARDHFDLGHGPVVVRTAPEEGNEEVATRRDDILIEVFTEVDNDFVAVDSRLVLLRDPIVHLEGERPVRVPLPAAVLRDVRKDADDDRALIAHVRSQGRGNSSSRCRRRNPSRAPPKTSTSSMVKPVTLCEKRISMRNSSCTSPVNVRESVRILGGTATFAVVVPATGRTTSSQPSGDGSWARTPADRTKDAHATAAARTERTGYTRLVRNHRAVSASGENARWDSHLSTDERHPPPGTPDGG